MQRVWDRTYLEYSLEKEFNHSALSVV